MADLSTHLYYCPSCARLTVAREGRCRVCSSPVVVNGSQEHRAEVIQRARFKLLALLVDIRSHVGRDNLESVIGPELHARFVELVGDGVQ